MLHRRRCTSSEAEVLVLMVVMVVMVVVLVVVVVVLKEAVLVKVPFLVLVSVSRGTSSK